MGELPVALNRGMKERIFYDGLVASMFGRDAISCWADNYSPDDDVWMNGERDYIKYIKRCLIRCGSEGGFNPGFWISDLDEFVGLWGIE